MPCSLLWPTDAPARCPRNRGVQATAACLLQHTSKGFGGGLEPPTARNRQCTLTMCPPRPSRRSRTACVRPARLRTLARAEAELPDVRRRPSWTSGRRRLSRLRLWFVRQSTTFRAEAVKLREVRAEVIAARATQSHAPDTVCGPLPCARLQMAATTTLSPPLGDG